jgi:hypothetical protein
MTESLYGTKNPSKTKLKPPSHNSTLSFTSNLSALISSSKPTTLTPIHARPKPSSTKPSIFTTHNKNVKKRSLADMADQQHKTKADLDSVSASELHRSKRKMAEKVRLYNAMKRGEHIGRPSESDLVDFDRKWADRQASPHSQPGSEDESEYSSESSAPHQNDTTSEEKTASYIDEFGRLIKTTPREAKRAQRRLARTTAISNAASSSLADSAAHPEAPSNIIYGDTIQHQAFNPDRVIQEQMVELAKKRDKESTPPPKSHYDANAEIRNRGTGFYAFSQDQELRQEEMEGLERERLRTEAARKEKAEQSQRTRGEGQVLGAESLGGREGGTIETGADVAGKERLREKRKREIEERRKLIASKRSKREAERFLDDLGVELDGAGDAGEVTDPLKPQ